MSSQEVPTQKPTDANEECVGPASEQAGNASSCEGCPNQEACKSGAGREVDPAIAEVADRLQSVKHVILVLSGKGGVGKSTISSQLAWSFADRGLATGICDIDICGPSIARMTGVENEEVRKSNYGWSPVYAHENLAVMSIAFMLGSKNDAVIWRGPRKNGLIKQFLTDVYWGELDVLIIDAPPGTSDEHISIATYLSGVKIDGALIVTTPQEIALLDVRKEISFCKKVNMPILGVVENMSGFTCPCCKHHSEIFPAVTGGAKGMCNSLNVPLIGSVPLDPQLLQCCERGVSFVSTIKDSAATQSWKQLVDSILSTTPELKELGETHPWQIEVEESA